MTPEHKALVAKIRKHEQVYLVMDGIIAQETSVVLGEAADAIEALAAGWNAEVDVVHGLALKLEAAEAKLVEREVSIKGLTSQLNGAYVRLEAAEAKLAAIEGSALVGNNKTGSAP